MKKPFKLALIQMSVLGGDRDRNLAHARQQIRIAASQGAKVAVLPELLDLGWTHPSVRELAGTVPGGFAFEQLAAEARRSRILVCAGLSERERGRIYNAAVIIDADGALLIKHRKLNELDIAHDLYAQGDRLNVCHTSLGTFGLMICADAFARDWVVQRSLGYMGADIILSPSSWAVAPDHDNSKTPYGELWRNCYQPVAREFGMWIAGVSNVGAIPEGPWKGWNCIGCSMVVDPQGEVRLQGPYGAAADTILYHEVELLERPARGTQWEKHWARPQ